MSDVSQKEREAKLRALADRMEFTVEKTGDRFTPRALWMSQRRSAKRASLSIKPKRF